MFLRYFFIHPSIDDTYSLGKHDGKKIFVLKRKCRCNKDTTTLLQIKPCEKVGGDPVDVDNYIVGGFNPSEKYARQIGSFYQIGMTTKHICDHHPNKLMKIGLKETFA